MPPREAARPVESGREPVLGTPCPPTGTAPYTARVLRTDSSVGTFPARTRSSASS
jgi:hypothetical protein